MTLGSAYPLLAAVRDKLAAVSGVATCKIGLEANMTPADYPMVRIVPSRLTNGPTISRRTVDCLIYFGQPIHEFSTGLEDQYQSLLAMEQALITSAQQTPTVAVIHHETILDEDRIDAYKLIAMRVEISG
jgi:hypothetical protein